MASGSGRDVGAREPSSRPPHHANVRLVLRHEQFRETRSTTKMIETGIAPADLGAPNHHSCGCCSSRAFAIFVDFARTAGRAAASELSKSRQVRAKLAKHSSTDRYRHRVGGPGRAEPQLCWSRCFCAWPSCAPPRKRPPCSASPVKSRPDKTTPFPRHIDNVSPFQCQNVGMLLHTIQNYWLH